MRFPFGQPAALVTCGSYVTFARVLLLMWLVNVGAASSNIREIKFRPREQVHGVLPKRTSTAFIKNNNDSVLSIPRGGAVPMPTVQIPSASVEDFFHAIDLFGTSIFAFSGAVTAGRKGMDILGMSIVACITAMGGGTVRDLLLGARGGPVFWIADSIYLKISLITSIFTFFLWPTLENKLGWKDSAKPVCVVDALGLAVFPVLGAQKALNMGFPPLIWVLSGLISSIFGGVVRDLLCLQNPRVMYPHRTMYAFGPLMASIVYTLLTEHCSQMFDTQTISVLSASVGFITRILSFNSAARLPHWEK